MSIDELQSIMCQVWNREISADDGFDELESLISEHARFKEALLQIAWSDECAQNVALDAIEGK